MSFDPKRKAIGSAKSSANLVRRGFDKLQSYLQEEPEPPEDEPLTSVAYISTTSVRVILIVAISTISGGLVVLLGEAIFGSAIDGLIEKVLESRITIAKAVIYLLLALLGGGIVARSMFKNKE
jgi:hypothetical protein